MHQRDYMSGMGNGHSLETSGKVFSQEEKKKKKQKALRKAWEITVSVHQGDFSDTVFILKRDENIQRQYTNDEVEVEQISSQTWLQSAEICNVFWDKRLLLLKKLPCILKNKDEQCFTQL